ncbi:MAG: hypothetical protein KatS3mg112_0508 [Thermogutta sp.]|nr:MAG: hypothetical protein KatS3mg112_0508 [Thermogutta sp.]
MTSNFSSSGLKADAQAALLEVLVHDRDALHHRVKDGEPLLTVHDEQVGHLLLAVHADGAVLGRIAVFPQKSNVPMG